LRCERLSGKNDFFDAQTHVHKSGGRQPAVANIAPGKSQTLIVARQVAVVR
jgi:hypothetical protein